VTDWIDPRFAAFLGVSVLFVVTPGPDTALTIRNALMGGFRAAAATALGVGTGSLAWALLSALGIAVVLQNSQPAFTVLKLAGAAYVVYLGLRSLFGRLPDPSSSLGKERQDSPASAARGQGDRAGSAEHKQAFRQGLVNNLLNPKAGAFFVALFPQFLDPGESGMRLLAMTLAYVAMVITWLCLYGYVVQRARETQIGIRLRQALPRLTGAVLIALGVRLAFERR
jgi:threonine/homoserine/homoserine lactone efflux protein